QAQTLPLGQRRVLQETARDLTRDEDRVTGTTAGWYDDGSGAMRWWDGRAWTDRVQAPPPHRGVAGAIDRARADASAGARPRPAPAGMNYVVLQVILKEKMWGTGSGNL